MDVKNPLYKRQGIHVDIATFTVDEGSVKVLLVRRNIEPFAGQWMLPGGACYNNESTDQAAEREMKEKTGLQEFHLEQFHAFSDPDRDPRMRMISIGYLALIDKNKVELLQRTADMLDAVWFNIDNLPKLAFDHNEMLEKALQALKKNIMKSNIVQVLLPKQFTMVELQKIYEVILCETMDRRNFRRKFLSLDLIKPTGTQKEAKGHRPALYYKFIDAEYKEVKIF